MYIIKVSLNRPLKLVLIIKRSKEGKLEMWLNNVTSISESHATTDYYCTRYFEKGHILLLINSSVTSQCSSVLSYIINCQQVNFLTPHSMYPFPFALFALIGRRWYNVCLLEQIKRRFE